MFDVIVPVLDRFDPPASVLAAGARNVERACRELGRTLRLGGVLVGLNSTDVDLGPAGAPAAPGRRG